VYIGFINSKLVLFYPFHICKFKCVYIYVLLLLFTQVYDFYFFLSCLFIMHNPHIIHIFTTFKTCLNIFIYFCFLVRASIHDVHIAYQFIYMYFVYMYGLSWSEI